MSVYIDMPSVFVDNENFLDFIQDYKIQSIITSDTIVQNGITSNIKVLPGQSLGGLLNSIGIISSQRDLVMSSKDLRGLTLFPGMDIRMHYDCTLRYQGIRSSRSTVVDGSGSYPLIHDESRECKLTDLLLYSGNDTNLRCIFSSNGELVVRKEKMNIKTLYRVISGSVEHSLYADALAANVPSSVIMHGLRQYSFILDFQRDIHYGDRFVFIFEEIVDADTNKKLRNGRLLFGDIILNGSHRSIYLFKDDYYNSSGDPVRKALLRTPVDGARISSNFGRRKHPILGYTRDHKGVDFAAPIGTPIHAAGDGIVEFVGTKSGYGKFVTIRHGRDLKTNYAHMNNFAKGITSGAKVSQRQVIGTIGMTGMTTGPHLHFEVVFKLQKVNPRGTYVDSGRKLLGRDKSEFKRIVENINSMMHDDA